MVPEPETIRKPTMVQDMIDNKDTEFLTLTGLEEFDEALEMAVEKIDLTTFDAQYFESLLKTA
jgi:hypothetical protein